jgi:hypothetical protein
MTIVRSVIEELVVYPVSNLHARSANMAMQTPSKRFNKFNRTVFLFAACSIGAALYGVYGLTDSVSQPICDWLSKINNNLCTRVFEPDGIAQGPTELEGWFQGLFVATLTILAFLAHAVRRPETGTVKDTSAWNLLKKLFSEPKEFLTAQKVCVPLFFWLTNINFLRSNASPWTQRRSRLCYGDCGHFCRS